MNDIQATDTSIPADLVIEDDCAAGIARARDVARVYAASLDPAAPADTSDALQLVVSELTTNALRHGGGHYTLQLSSGPDSVSVAVSDNSSVLPQERTPTSPDAPAVSAGTWSATTAAAWPSPSCRGRERPSSPSCPCDHEVRPRGPTTRSEAAPPFPPFPGTPDRE